MQTTPPAGSPPLGSSWRERAAQARNRKPLAKAPQRNLETPHRQSVTLLKRAKAMDAKLQNCVRPASSLLIAQRPSEPNDACDLYDDLQLPHGSIVGVTEARGVRPTMQDAFGHAVWGKDSVLVLCDGHAVEDRSTASRASRVIIETFGEIVERLTPAQRDDAALVVAQLKDAFVGKVDSLLQRVLGTLKDQGSEADIPAAVERICTEASERWDEDPDSTTQALRFANQLAGMQATEADFGARLDALIHKHCGPIARAFITTSPGTTALAALRLGERMYMVNLGDSRALWVHDTGQLQQLTCDHNTRFEKERLEKHGVPVWKDRINGVLAPSRVLGDAALNAYIKRRPEVTCFDIPPEGGHLILGCDGIFDNLINRRAALCLKTINSPLQGAKAIRDLAYKSGSADNLTVAVVSVPGCPSKPSDP